ncbi:MAG: aminopeptidase N, partial [Desulfocapsa sp.]|nr:aminopeptidase N [Desulfocapsa sp.]
MSTQQHSAIYRKDYQVPDFLIHELYLDFQLNQNDCVVNAKSVFRRHPKAAENCEELFLNGENLQLLNAAVNGKPLTENQYRLEDDGIVLLNMKDEFVLEIGTRIYPDKNTALEGLYRTSGNFCTQCEAEGFRKITYFLDRPDVMVKFTTTIFADREKYPVLLSNGNPADSGDGEDGRHWCKWEDPFKKPCYLFALVAGDLAHIEDHFTTMSGKNVCLRIYVQ